MPRPRDQRLYFELQGKLTQQEVDYNNMHQHHTIVRAPQGKVTGFKLEFKKHTSNPKMQLRL